ncbi:lactate racemase domain-containing protein [Bacillus sp. JJ1562]|uniref:lactate racemase domain-containing protein n=1 Tax=Bacillus sp. JJ1562 TaxID=3122960 RepID=UPI0030028DE3
MNSYPKMVKIRQTFNNNKIENIVDEITRELSQEHIKAKIHPGAKIAIAVGSRGIANLKDVVKTVVNHIKELGGEPFLVPAMGSHGGATSEGQKKILLDYGLSPENIGAPIYSSMEVVQIGTVGDHIPVYFDRNASEADAIIVINRVKPHTNFKSDIESGVIKMLTVGLGKQKGAEVIHSHGIYGLKNLIPEMGKLIIEKMPIAFGLALVENAYDELTIIKTIPAEDLIEVEKKLLVKAKSLMPSLPSNEIDILLVDEMGKNISGTGMDPNIIGRIYVRGQEEPKHPDIKYIGVFDLTPESHGNAIGIGYADLTTQQLVDNIDLNYTYMNTITSVFPTLAKIPITLQTERELVDVAIQFLQTVQMDDLLIVRIRNTLSLDELEVSEALWEKIKDNQNFEQIGPPYEMKFNNQGELQ